MLEERVRMIKELDTLLKRRMRGSPNDYAEKLGISRSTFFRLIEYVRLEFNAPLIYNKEESRYEYDREGRMFFGFLPSDVIPNEMLKKINGGSISQKDNKLFLKIFCLVSTGGTDPTYI